MSFQPSLETLSDAMSYYLEQLFPAVRPKDLAWYMDTNTVDGSVSYPDMSNQFDEQKDAIEYLLNEGIPIWLVSRCSGLPVDVFTLAKYEFIFGEHE